MRRPVMILSLIVALSAAGCGYTTRSLIKPEYKTIDVENVENKIQVAAEQDNLRMYRGYRPGMEVELTKAIIDRYIFDGNLKVVQNNGDLILTTELIDFRREPLRYDANDNIEEYRVKMVVNIALQDGKTGDVQWQEKGFSGETTYRVYGAGSTSENVAVSSAIQDTARRIVERTVEAW
jgi:hypothetical protein